MKTMTIGEVIAELGQYDRDMPLLLQVDQISFVPIQSVNPLNEPACAAYLSVAPQTRFIDNEEVID